VNNERKRCGSVRGPISGNIPGEPEVNCEKQLHDWCPDQDLNPAPSAYKSQALSLETSSSVTLLVQVPDLMD
jgi:hypothetical protein